MIQIRLSGIISGLSGHPQDTSSLARRAHRVNKAVDPPLGVGYSWGMKKLVYCSQMEAIDRETQKTMLPILLIEQAALRLWTRAREVFPELDADSKLVFLCGGGNNGSDALAAARCAACEGYRDITCIVLPRGNELHQMEQFFLETYPVKLVHPEEAVPVVRDADFIFEGLCGTGLKNALGGMAKVLVDEANENHHARKIAIDVPAGLADELPCSDATVFHADLTVTMGLEKVVFTHPLLRAICGRIDVVNPCFPLARLEACDTSFFEADDWDAFPLRALSSDAYKKTRGHLCVFGGSSRFPGAARLSCRAAFHSRAGLITWYVDDDCLPIAASESPSVMVRRLSDGFDLAPADAVLAGPGWGEGRGDLLLQILKAGRPTVLDADGIRAYAAVWKEQAPTQGLLVMTPHLGELAVLSKAVLGLDVSHGSIREFLEGIQEIARKTKSVLVVKGSVVDVATATDVTVFDGGNPSLGVAGSGDVLSGVIGALLAGGMSVKDAALTGTALHQKAGRRASEAEGYYDSEALIALLGQVVREAER